MKLTASITSWLVMALLYFAAPQLRASYLYATLDPPGSIGTTVNGIDGTTLVGSYQDSSKAYHGFLYNGSTYTTLDFPGASGTVSNTYALGVSGSNVVGHYLDSSSVSHSFLYNGSTYSTIDPPGAGASYATAVSGNYVTGYYYNANSSGGAVYLYDGTTFTSLAPTGSVSTSPAGVSGSTVAGNYVDGNDVAHGFLYSGGNYTVIDPPNTLSTQITAISGTNVIGYYTGIDNVPRGFLYSGGVYTDIVPPGSTSAYAYGFSGDKVSGAYTDANNVLHRFLESGGIYTILDPPNTTGDMAVYPSGGTETNVVGYLTDNVGVNHGFLATVVTSFAQWVATNSPSTTNPALSAPTATPENDGVPNLLKYLYDINPSTTMSATDQAALPVVGLNTAAASGTPALTLTYRQNAAAADVTVNVQTSTDLQTWQTVTPDVTQQVGTDANTGDPFIQYQVQASGPKQFIRLQVSSTP